MSFHLQPKKSTKTAKAGKKSKKEEKVDKKEKPEVRKWNQIIFLVLSDCWQLTIPPPLGKKKKKKGKGTIELLVLKVDETIQY